MENSRSAARAAPVNLQKGERLLWQGTPAAPPRIPARPAHAVVTLSSAFGFWAFWIMVPELPALRNALLFPIAALLAMAAYPPFTAPRRARAFFNSARYTLTNRRAICAHAGKTVEIPLSAATKAHLGEGETPTLILWNPAPGASQKAVFFHQLENGEEPYRIAKSILEPPP